MEPPQNTLETTTSSQSFIDEIKSIADTLQGNPGDGELVSRLTLLCTNYQTWLDEQPECDVEENFSYWCSTLYKIGSSLSLPYYEPSADGGVGINGYRKAWLEYFVDLSTRPPEPEVLIKWLKSAFLLLKEYQREEEDIYGTIEELQSTIERLRQLSLDDIKQRRNNEREILTHESSILSLRNKLLSITDDASEALLPQGKDLSIFDASNSFLEPDFSFVTRALADALDLAIGHLDGNPILNPGETVEQEQNTSTGVDDGDSHQNSKIKPLYDADLFFSPSPEVEPLDFTKAPLSKALNDVVKAPSKDPLMTFPIVGQSLNKPCQPLESETEKGPLADKPMTESLPVTTETALETEPSSSLVNPAPETIGDELAEDSHSVIEDHPIDDLSAGEPVSVTSELTEKPVFSQDYSQWDPIAIECKSSLDKDVFLPGHQANEALSALALSGRLEYAAALSSRLEESALSSDHIPSSLFQAAFYGMNTWDDRAIFTRSSRLLGEISTTDIARWREQGNADILPYLLFLAAFQPSVFGGNASIAVTWLRDLVRDASDQVFDTNTLGLMEDTIELANRNEKITLQNLRTLGKEADKSPEFDLSRLEHWRQRIRQSRKGYAPILKATTLSLDSGILGEIDRIIQSNKRSEASTVVKFVDQFSDIEGSNLLLQELLPATNTHDGEGITRLGKQRFFHKINELVEIARDWLLLVQHSYRNHADDYNKRFMTRIQQAADHFAELAQARAGSVSRQAGIQLMATHLNNISDVLGDPKKAFYYVRANGWFHHPDSLMKLQKVPDKTMAQVYWLLSCIGKPVDYYVILQSAVSGEHIQLAELASLALKEIGDTRPRPDTEALLRDKKRSIMERCRKLDGLLESAVLSALIDPPKAEIYSSGLDDTGESLSSLYPIDNLEDIDDYLDEVESTLVDLNASTKHELELRFNQTLASVQASMGDQAVPEEWLRDIHAAFEADNLPVITEMLEELEVAEKSKSQIRLAESSEVKNIPALRDFLSVEPELFQLVKSADSLKKLWSELSADGHRYGIDISHFGSGTKRMIEILYSWQVAGKPKATMDKDVYDRINGVLSLAGIIPHKPQYSGAIKDSLNYRTTHGFSTSTLAVQPTPSSRPFALLGESAGVTNISIIVAYKEWTVDQLEDVIESHYVHHDAILISSLPLSIKQREELARFTKSRHKTIFHLDPVSLLFLASQEQSTNNQVAIRNFLWLMAPFTYFNPYSGDSPMPPSREMRYGRETQIGSLLKMVGGSAIVFGGRQLGKSTIMQEVEARFHRPQNNEYAFYEMLDANFGNKLEINEDGIKRATHKIWESLYGCLHRNGLIRHPVAQRTIDNIDGIIASVKDAILSHKEHRFLAIFDEIDPILRVDSAFDFSIFRGIRDFVAQQEVSGRFKVIIGGLANVKRFEDYPNYPLTQMGGSIQVSILPTQEALHLIIEPLRAAGYEFDNAQVANRILALTNRHPGLIQIFCHELIIYLSENNTQSVGSRLIMDEDVVNVGRQDKVLGLIRGRFDMTLNLDKRYQVIIYSIIADGRGSQPFYPGEAKELAECWLPESFGHISRKQFEAFLIELVGLGVLKQFADGRYAIRNTNVLKLLSDERHADISDELEKAIEECKNYDPLDRHSFDIKKHAAPYPITCRDEKAILGINETGAIASPIRKPGMLFTVSLIVGSNALGLNEVKNTLPTLYADETGGGPLGAKHSYNARNVSTDDYPSPAVFQEKLINPLINLRSKDGPQMAFITIGPKTELVDILGMIDAAHSQSDKGLGLLHPVRMIFLLDPLAYWKWLSAPELTRQRESLQPFIMLSHWSSDAVRSLLERLGLTDSTQATDAVMAINEGWYFSLKILIDMAIKHRDWKDISQFTKTFKALDKLSSAEVVKVIELTGLNEVPEGLATLKALFSEYGEARIDLDALQLAIEEVGIEAADRKKARQLADWLHGIGLIVKVRSDKKNLAVYQIPRSIRHAMEVITSNA